MSERERAVLKRTVLLIRDLVREPDAGVAEQIADAIVVQMEIIANADLDGDGAND